MKIEEFKTFAQDILTNLNDQGKVSEILTNLIEDYSTVDKELNELTTNISKFKEDNEKLRTANMNLFLKIGDTPKEAETKPLEVSKNIEPKQARTFEALFNEKGGLK